MSGYVCYQWSHFAGARQNFQRTLFNFNTHVQIAKSKDKIYANKYHKDFIVLLCFMTEKSFYVKIPSKSQYYIALNERDSPRIPILVNIKSLSYFYQVKLRPGCNHRNYDAWFPIRWWWFRMVGREHATWFFHQSTFFFLFFMSKYTWGFRCTI